MWSFYVYYLFDLLFIYITPSLVIIRLLVNLQSTFLINIFTTLMESIFICPGMEIRRLETLLYITWLLKKNNSFLGLKLNMLYFVFIFCSKAICTIMRCLKQKLTQSTRSTRLNRLPLIGCKGLIYNSFNNMSRCDSVAVSLACSGYRQFKPRLTLEESIRKCDIIDIFQSWIFSIVRVDVKEHGHIYLKSSPSSQQ